MKDLLNRAKNIILFEDIDFKRKIELLEIIDNINKKECEKTKCVLDFKPLTDKSFQLIDKKGNTVKIKADKWCLYDNEYIFLIEDNSSNEDKIVAVINRNILTM